MMRQKYPASKTKNRMKFSFYLAPVFIEPEKIATINRKPSVSMPDLSPIVL